MNEFNIPPEFEDKIRKAVNVPDARSEFVSQLRNELINRPVKAKPVLGWRPALKPTWVIALIVVGMLLAISAPAVVAALNQLFGYVPGVGLVETISEMRVLEAPVTEKRDEITLTLNQVLAYQDHIELSYTVEGIPAEKRFNPEIDAGNEGMFCLGADSYPSMLLPDGATIEADPMSLGGKWLKDQSGYYVGHSFSTPVPKNIANARFVLKCLSEMKRGETPEDWSLPFNLVPAQEGKAVGAPIINVETSDLSKATDKGITLTLNQVVEEEDGYVMYVTMGWDQTNNSRLATAPMSFTVTDASGQTILVSPIDRPGRPWNDEEKQFAYKMASSPAEGPLTVTVDNVWAFYTMDKTKEMMEQPGFTFDAGANPQVGQTWTLDQHFKFGDLQFDIPSARMVEQDGHKGYEFLVQTSDPGSLVLLNIGDFNNPNYWSGYPTEHGATLLYEGETPQSVNVLVYKIGVGLDGKWQVTWTPPAQ